MRAKEKRKQEEALQAWTADREELHGMIEFAEDFVGAPAAEAPGFSLVLKNDELAVADVSPVALVEPRRGKGQYQGGSSGFSFRVAKGVSYRVGANRGTFTSGVDEQTVIDQGGLAITTKRAVFLGSKQTREWAFSKVLSVDYAEDSNSTLIHVSNRQKVSGILCGDEGNPVVRFRLELAMAIFNQTQEALVTRLRSDMAELEASRPGGPVSGEISPPEAAMWERDPTGRHEHRYWDGQEWTGHVADNGVQSEDPM